MSDIIAATNLYVDNKQTMGPGRSAVLRAFAVEDLTDQEVAERTGLPVKSTSARRVELWRNGLVEPIAMKRMIRQRAKVWSLTPAGRLAVEALA